MNIELPNGSGQQPPSTETSPGAVKARQYAERILAGENEEQVLDGLGPIFRNSVVELVNSATAKSVESSERFVQNIELPNIDEIIRNGGGQLSVISNGEPVGFKNFAVIIDGNYAEVGFVEKEDKTKNRGVGIAAYIALGKKLVERGIVLRSSDAQYSDGANLWKKLAAMGYAVRKGNYFEFSGAGPNENNPKVFSLLNGAVEITASQNRKQVESALCELILIKNSARSSLSDGCFEILGLLGVANGRPDIMRRVFNDSSFLDNLISEIRIALGQ